MSEEEKNIIDKVTDDSTKIVITTRSVKWILGILSGTILSLLGFAWGLYVKVDSKVDIQFDKLNDEMHKNKTEIIDKIIQLEKDKVEKNKEKNYTQDIDIVRLYERVDSRDDKINGNTHRPENLNNTSVPSFDN
jgi:hypothetical protein